MQRTFFFLTFLSLALGGCASSNSNGSVAPKHIKPPVTALKYPAEPADAEPSYTQQRPVLLSGATVMTAAGEIHSPGYILFDQGRIQDVGAGMKPANVPANTVRIDAGGRFITPGIIDTHSHMGVYPAPHTASHSDGNEATHRATPEVWAEHSFWPQDPSLPRALAGGITTIQVLPGSANLIGGRSFTAKLKPANSARLMRFPNAPQGLKMACGENPKRVYGERGGPSTRMGNVAGYREAFQKALEYRHKQRVYERDLAAWEAEHDGADATQEDIPDPPTPPTRDLGLESLAGVLDGEILVHNHCYRADEMHIMLDLAKSFGFKIRSFHHALEAYKLRDRLATEDTAVSTWADWWGFKMEAFDGIPQNAALLTQAGARAIIHSDSASDIRHLNQEAAKALRAGEQLGITLNENDALRWITANPAWALGIEEDVGTLEPGRMADLVIWDKHPFSTYARVDQVFIDGTLQYDRHSPEPLRRADFEVGLFPTTSTRAN